MWESVLLKIPGDYDYLLGFGTTTDLTLLQLETLQVSPVKINLIIAFGSFTGRTAKGKLIL